MAGPEVGVFVGRGPEIAELERALEEARMGRGTGVLIGGDAGIGKSRLVSELAARAGRSGVEVLVGHCLDLAGAELPYHPFVDALRPWGDPWTAAANSRSASQWQVFEATRSLLEEHSRSTPVLLALEDLHWADVSSGDLIAFLAHHVRDMPVLMVATARVDEMGSRERVHRLIDAIRHSEGGRVLVLPPLGTGDMGTLLGALGGERLPRVVVEEIVARSEGNPFFAEELRTAAQSGSGELPHSLRALLLHRTEGLDGATLEVLRLAAAAGRDAGYAMLRRASGQPEAALRTHLRRAVERGVLVTDTERVGFRHALLAEAVYGTVLPGEREDLHRRLALSLSEAPNPSPAELARHWTAAADPARALPAWLEAARRATRMSGLTEALGHLEQALTLWERVPEAEELTGTELVELCSWAAETADNVGAAARAVELAKRAVDLVGPAPSARAVLLHVHLGEYLYGTGNDDTGLAMLGRAVKLADQPGTPERAFAVASLAGGLMVTCRYSEALPLARQALAETKAGRDIGAELRALTVLGVVLVHQGDVQQGLRTLDLALARAEAATAARALSRIYVNYSDVLITMGRLRDAVSLAAAGLETARKHGLVDAVLACNHIEALIAVGDWAAADVAISQLLRSGSTGWPYMVDMLRADLETQRGDFPAARRHLARATRTLRPDHGYGNYEAYVAELAWWDGRWADAHEALVEARTRAASAETAPRAVWFCAKALRAHAELAALARDRRDADGLSSWTRHAEQALREARVGARTAAPITPMASIWLSLAEAEHTRVLGASDPDAFADAADGLDRLERPALAAYCRWRQAEALLDTGATRRPAQVPLRGAYAQASRLGAKPLMHELEALAQRGRVSLTPPEPPVTSTPDLADGLGLTPREGEVLALVAQGLTNPEISQALVISDKTTSIHVSHILHKLGVTNRHQAAAIAHRFGQTTGAAPTADQPSL